jgi:DNA-binding NtrC family response regulator
VAAVAAGAYDYLTKPFDIDEVAVVIDRALEAHALRLANRRAAERRSAAASSPTAGRCGASSTPPPGSPTATSRCWCAARPAPARSSSRQLLHAQSGGPPAAGAVQLRGAAGRAGRGRAVRSRPRRVHRRGRHGRGFFAEADGGTLVLDEVGELPLAIQAKLLRALQEGEIQPVGSGRIERVDVRVVAATHRDLPPRPDAGGFREDLYYRLAVVELVVPPLRERADDIPALARGLRAPGYGDKFGLPTLILEPALVSGAGAAPWPGNVRQLENVDRPAGRAGQRLDA